MRRLIIVFLLVGLSQLLSVSFVGAEPTQTRLKSAKTSMIGYIKNEDLVDMCGCTFEHRTGTRGNTFAADASNEIAWMNIDGEDVKLKLTHSGGSKVHRIGSRYTQSYEAEGVKALLVMIVNNPRRKRRGIRLVSLEQFALQSVLFLGSLVLNVLSSQ